jgi:hypothetical protein
MDTDVIAGAVPVPDAPKSAGLFPPPDSNRTMMFDDSDSELSEIGEDGTRVPKPPKMPDIEVVAEPKEPEVPVEQKEPEVDDIGEVVPDHYADEGRVPVFKPTMAQFKDFQIFVRFGVAPV